MSLRMHSTFSVSIFPLVFLLSFVIAGCASPERAIIANQGIIRAPHGEFSDLRYEGQKRDAYDTQSNLRALESELDELQLAKAALTPNREPLKPPPTTLAEFEQAIKSKKDALAEAKRKHEKFQSRRDGIYACDGGDQSNTPCVAVKLRGKPLISIIDEAARVRRFNYTVTTDISRFYVDIFDDFISDDKRAAELETDPDASLIEFKRSGYSVWNRVRQKKYQSVDEFVKQIVKSIHVSYRDAEDKGLRESALNLRVRWIGDGFLFYDENNDPEKSASASRDSKEQQVVEDKKGGIGLEQEEEGSNSVRFKSDECQKIFELEKKEPKGSLKFADHACNKATEDEQLKRQKLAQQRQSNYQFQATENKTIERAGETKDTVTFKKIFLYNLSQKEVGYYLSKLFGFPYNEYSPEYSARQLTQYIGLTDGKLLDKPVQNLGQREYIQPPNDFPMTIGQEGSWISIPQQNSIIVKGKYETLQKISQMLYAIDSEYRQVLIEAKVFEYDSSINRKIGNTLGVTKTRDGNVSGKVGLTNKALEREFGQDVAAALPTAFFDLADAERKLALLSTLAFYDRDGLVRITAEPRLVVKPGQESIIDLSVTKYVQVTAQGQGAVLSDLKLVPTGIVLVIRPTLLSDDKIQLDFILRQSEFVPSQEKEVLLATNSNQVLSSIVVNDGELVTIGGISTQKFNKSHGGYPSLKDAPLVGMLFGAKSTEYQSTRVEFMIRPSIKDLGYRKYQIHEQTAAKEQEVSRIIQRDLGLAREAAAPLVPIDNSSTSQGAP